MQLISLLEKKREIFRLRGKRSKLLEGPTVYTTQRSASEIGVAAYNVNRGCRGTDSIESTPYKFDNAPYDEREAYRIAVINRLTLGVAARNMLRVEAA